MAYDFPNAPTIGQVANGYTWDGEKWVTNFSTANPGGVIAIQVFTASGTYTPSPNMSSCVIECVGGGGGGGTVNGLVGYGLGAGGGGSGSYSRSMKTAAQIGSSQPVTIGAGATQEASGNPTSVGSIVVANGGAQGNAFYAGAGALPGSGDLAAPGASGVGGQYLQPASDLVLSGSGGSSVFGGGGVSVYGTRGGYNNGVNGASGGGGSGGAMSDRTGAAYGGTGGDGLVVITEYGLTALTGNSVTTAVRYDVAQTLTTPQQAQARTNINAPSFTDINAAVNPIPKNYVLNGGMTVSQENGNVVGSANGYYPVDQFTVVMGGTTGIFSAQQVASVTPGNSPNRIRVTCTTADAAVAASDMVTIWQAIEGYRVADLRYGAAGALQTTLRFGVKAPAGTYGVCIINRALARSYVATFTITAGQTNTDTVQTIVIPGDTLGTWDKDYLCGMYVQWCLMGGTTYQTTAGWKAGNFLTTSAQFNFMGATARVFELFDVGLYIGATAPPFLVPDYAAELAACQRYYYTITAPFSPPYVGTNVWRQLHEWPVTMRNPPTVTATMATGGDATKVIEGISSNSASIGANTTQNGAYLYNVIANARM